MTALTGDCHRPWHFSTLCYSFHKQWEENFPLASTTGSRAVSMVVNILAFDEQPGIATIFFLIFPMCSDRP